METTRREILKVGGLGVLTTVGLVALPVGSGVAGKQASELSERNMPHPLRLPFVRSPVLRPHGSSRDPDGVPVDHYAVVERRGRVHVLPGGLATTVFGYDGLAPGPTLKVRQGRRVRLRVRNHLPLRHPQFGNEFTTSTHLHGQASLPQYDGYASDVTPPGFVKDYRYPNDQHARTLWYHDHGVHHTTENGYSGLVAQYHIHDPEEEALLPQAEFDVPLTVQDVIFRSDGELLLDDSSQSRLDGDVILVNGRPWPVMRVKRRIYRFRIVNTSLSRSYRFALSTGDDVAVVATDAGLVPRVQQVDQWRQSVSERYEVLIDFARYRPGQQVVLRNLSNPNNVDFEHTGVVMAFDVTAEAFDRADPTWNRIPDRLVDSEVMHLTPAMADRTRRLRFERQGGQWKINRRTWADVIDSDFELLAADPDLGDVEVWELENRSGGWFHPVHIHLIDFRILDRNGRPPFDYELGPKDTAYVGENETVRVIMRFGPHRGRYMVHCHNLVHEDHDMMSQFAVGWKPGQPDPNHPILAAPPRPDDPPEPPTAHLEPVPAAR